MIWEISEFLFLHLKSQGFMIVKDLQTLENFNYNFFLFNLSSLFSSNSVLVLIQRLALIVPPCHVPI